jgi:sphingomyelin phosphodiesterase acid-like 3
MSAVLIACALLAPRGVGAAAAPWLLVSDVHLDPRATSTAPASFGKDTNEALFRSALAAMQRADPNPPVVVIGGDFLAHDIRPEDAITTETAIAEQFGSTFPHAQFVVTLGNEDSDCGDYRLAANSAFLRAFAAAWAPLVDRRGAAPGFATTFPRDGFYVAQLPVHRLRAVVVDDVVWAPRFQPCGRTREGAARVLAELRGALPLHGERTWVLMHIPPGIDAYSTIRLAHELLVVPLLDPAPRASAVDLLEQPERDVALVLTGHVHRFSFRLLERPGEAAPLFTMPAISPIYGNTPSFVTADIASDGTLLAADEHALVDGVWRDLGGTRALGMPRVDSRAIGALLDRLAFDPTLRARWSRLYNGAGRPEITQRSWRGYWCATFALTATGFRDCIGTGGVGIFTTRGLIAAIAGLALLAVVASGAVVLLLRRARRVSAR